MKQLLPILLILGLTVYVVAAVGYGDEEAGAEEEPEFEPKNGCMLNGQWHPVGYSYEMTDKCKVCDCCKTGKFKCKPVKCTTPPPECGKDHYESEDACCPVCSPACLAMKPNCPSLANCQGPIVYPDPECCGICGCDFRGDEHLPGDITAKPTAACEKCKCKPNGVVKCKKQAPCPATKLKCVDPEVMDDNQNCNWHCPNGQSCRRGADVIAEGEKKEVGDKVCRCYDQNGAWHPIAMCANLDGWSDIEEILKEDRCLKKPCSISLWNQYT